MVLGGRALTDRTATRRVSAIAARRRALAVTALVFTGVALTGAVTASAARLPPVQITYSGSMSIEVFPTAGKPSHQLRTIGWNATANSAGSDGGLALDFSSVSVERPCSERCPTVPRMDGGGASSGVPRHNDIPAAGEPLPPGSEQGAT